MIAENEFPYGFYVVGSCREARRLTVAEEAFRSYCECDDRADVGEECYLSAEKSRCQPLTTTLVSGRCWT